MTDDRIRPAEDDGEPKPQTPFWRSPGDDRTGEQPSPVADHDTIAPEDRAERSAGGGATAVPARSRDRRGGLLVPVVAAAVVASLIGGSAGAGIALALTPRPDAAVSNTGAAAPSGITINDSATATRVAAVAQSASPSVVTIAVSGGGSAGSGSGIVLDTEGHVLTNNHVVTLGGATKNAQLSVTTAGGRISSASVIGTDPTNDLAVIKMNDASGAAPATFADSAKLNVGDTAIAIGAPLGLSNTVTNGIVSALNRSISVQSSAVPDSTSVTQGGQDPFNFWNDQQGQQAPTTGSGSISLSVIQTDAAINPGNSGGALLDSRGRVIGVNVAIASAASGSADSQAGSIGVGFAIPSNVALRVADQLKRGKQATHGLLGASVGNVVSGSVAGARVQTLSNGGAAAKAGLRKGDVITSLNGVAVQGADDLTAQVRSLAGGARAKLVYQRDGRATAVTVELGTYRVPS